MTALEWSPDLDDLVRAVRALAVMLKAEYHSEYSVETVVSEWGPDAGLSQADIAAINRLAPLLRD